MRENSARRGMVLSLLFSAIDADRQEGTSLSSAIRLFVFDHLSSGRGADWRAHAA
jgi:predicted DNA-binding ribbon-helix-helix protein